MAEVDIQATKQHFLRIIAGVETNLPMNQWEHLLPQSELTLNLLQQSNTTPTVSAYAAMFGPFKYNRIPRGLMRCAVLINEKSNTRTTWDNHAVYGWNLYTSSDHYCAHVCQVKKTNYEQVSDTVVFQHK